jgi:hypothetical protein
MTKASVATAPVLSLAAWVATVDRVVASEKVICPDAKVSPVTPVMAVADTAWSVEAPETLSVPVTAWLPEFTTPSVEVPVTPSVEENDPVVAVKAAKVEAPETPIVPVIVVLPAPSVPLSEIEVAVKPASVAVLETLAVPDTVRLPVATAPAVPAIGITLELKQFSTAVKLAFICAEAIVVPDVNVFGTEEQTTA